MGAKEDYNRIGSISIRSHLIQEVSMMSVTLGNRGFERDEEIAEKHLPRPD